MLLSVMLEATNCAIRTGNLLCDGDGDNELFRSVTSHLSSNDCALVVHCELQNGVADLAEEE